MESVEEARARIVLAAISDSPGAATLEDVVGIPRLAGWEPVILEMAIADLVADGLLASDAFGHLIVVPRRSRSAA